ncbi:MAG: hypothetical protein U9Q22_01435, partial [Candidatus Altiarchaeota archaeon]|nr:hypothetical protein [Candidatus Altiarchaeota archaeon]
RKDITYKLYFDAIPLPLNNKEYIIPAAVFKSDSGETYNSDSVSIYIAGLPEINCNFNDVCDGKENYKTCPQDCSSGGKDDYCDGKKDLICDLDCRAGEDPDCINIPGATIAPTTTLPEKPGGVGDYLPYIVVLFILILLIYLVRRRMDARRINQEREEFLRWRREREIREKEEG